MSCKDSGSGFRTCKRKTSFVGLETSRGYLVAPTAFIWRGSLSSRGTSVDIHRKDNSWHQTPQSSSLNYYFALFYQSSHIGKRALKSEIICYRNVLEDSLYHWTEVVHRRCSEVKVQRTGAHVSVHQRAIPRRTGTRPFRTANRLRIRIRLRCGRLQRRSVCKISLPA